MNKYKVYVSADMSVEVEASFCKEMDSGVLILTDKDDEVVAKFNYWVAVIKE